MNKRKDNGEGSIFQRKDGRWVAKIQVDGKLKTFYGKTQKEAKQKLKDFKKLLDYDVNLDYQNIYLDEYIMRWLQLNKKIKLKQNSYDRLYDTINTNIIPYMGNTKLKDITNSQIQSLLIELMDKPSPVYKDKKMSYSSIKKVYEALNACLNYAVDNKHIISNPCKLVELPNKDNFEQKELPIFTDSEVDKIVSTAISKYKNDKYIYPSGAGVILLFNTGIRLGELLALKWSDVDLDKRLLYVNKNISMTSNRDNDNHGKYEILFKNTPKTKSSNRVIPLNDNCIKALDILKSVRYGGKNSFIILSANNTVTYPDTFKRTFKSILKRADVSILNLHSCRHTFASKLFREKVDIKVISSLLGHSTVAITYNIYIHIIQEEKASAINVLDNIF